MNAQKIINILQRLQVLIQDIESTDFATAHDLALTEKNAEIKTYIKYLEQYTNKVPA